MPCYKHPPDPITDVGTSHEGTRNFKNIKGNRLGLVVCDSRGDLLCDCLGILKKKIFPAQPLREQRLLLSFAPAGGQVWRAIV